MRMEQDQRSRQNLRDKDDDEVSSGGSAKQIKLKNPRDHTSKATHEVIVRDPIYRACFTVGERTSNWFGNVFRCTDSESSYVNNLNEVERKHPVSVSEDWKKLFQDRIVKIKIVETSRLELNPNVMHPFVRVHILDKNTGCYLQRNGSLDEPIIYHQESVTFYDPIEKKYDSSQNDMLLPFATSCSDFRELGNSRGKWNQKFFIDLPAQQFFTPNTVILFQILDFNHQALTYKDTDIFDRDNFFRVAWSYLRPVGIHKIHVGKSMLELFRYKFNNKTGDDAISKPHIPSVYYDFLWNSHEKYDGFLTVQLNYVARPKIRYVEEGGSQFPSHMFQEDRADKRFLDKYTGDLQVEEVKGGPKFNEKMLKFMRSRQLSQIPKELVYKLESSKLGCYRAKFIGNKVFTACSMRKYTAIKVYSLENGQQVMCLKGHRQMIYTMVSSQNQKYLATGGSDFIVRIWQIPEDVGQFIDQDESQSYIRGECVHSAAIYSISVVHIPLQERMSVLTCCYDGYIRLWHVDLVTRKSKVAKEININNYERSSQRVYPTAAAVSDSNYFIVGDSRGDIRIFDFAHDSLNMRCLLTHDEISNDIIISIKILSKNHLIIQSGDNLLRHFQVSNNRLKVVDKYNGAQFQSLMATCAVSPDNKYLLCPSETGKPYMWDILTGIKIDLDHLHLDIKGPLAVCDWHPKYNLVLFAGFVELCPIFVYGNILSEAERRIVAAQTIS